MRTKSEYPKINFTDTAVNDSTNPALLADINAAAAATGVFPTVYVAKTGHDALTDSGTPSRHSTNQAVDLSILNGVGCPGCTEKTITPTFAAAGDKIVNYLISNCGYSNGETTDKAIIWKADGHWNHVHVSNKTKVPGCKGVVASTTGDTTSLSGGTTTPDSEIDQLVKSMSDMSMTQSIFDTKGTASTPVTEEINRIKKLMK